MTSKDKNIKLAENLGIKPEKYFRKTVWIYGGSMHPKPPDYYNDLNAIHIATQSLGERDGDEYTRYWNILRSLTGSALDATEADSKTRCDALGLVKGLWTQHDFTFNE